MLSFALIMSSRVFSKAFHSLLNNLDVSILKFSEPYSSIRVQQITDRDLVYVDGRLVMDDAFVISVIDFDDDVQFGQLIEYLCRDADRYAVSVRQFIRRIRLTSFHEPFYDQRGDQRREKSLYRRLQYSCCPVRN